MVTDPSGLDELARAVQASDAGATSMARRIGAGAVPRLRALLDAPAFEVRELAVDCLAATMVEAAVPALVLALADPHVQVAMAAASGLESLGRPMHVPVLIDALDRPKHPLVRRALALVVGRVAGPGKIDALRARLDAESSPLAREGLVMALARLGDADARTRFVDREGEDLEYWLEDADYLAGPWLLPTLGRLLDDQTPILWVNGAAGQAYTLRACDLALVRIARITGHRFEFQGAGARSFSPGELDEARRFIVGVS